LSGFLFDDDFIFLQIPRTVVNREYKQWDSDFFKSKLIWEYCLLFSIICCSFQFRCLLSHLIACEFLKESL